MDREIEIGGGRRRHRCEGGLGSGVASVSRQCRGKQAVGPECHGIDGGAGGRRHGLEMGVGSSDSAGGGGASGSRHGWAVWAAPARLLVWGVDFAPNTQEPDAVEEEDCAGLEFVPGSEEDSSDSGLLPYDSDKVQFVPDSEIGAEDKFVPDSVLDDGAAAEEVDGVGAQLDE